MLDLHSILSIIGIFISMIALFWMWKSQEPVHTECGFKSTEQDGSLVVTFKEPFKNGIPVVQLTPLSYGQNTTELSNVLCFKVAKVDKNGFTAKQSYYSAVDHTLHAGGSTSSMFWFASENSNGVQAESINDPR
jgi:hypothetical protein